MFFWNKNKTRTESAPEGKEFWLHGNGKITSLLDLKSALEEMSAETFSHHVTSAKNDFANWIEDALGDENLAKEISNARTRESALMCLNRCIK